MRDAFPHWGQISFFIIDLPANRALPVMGIYREIFMPTSKKQLVKLNQVKKAKAEELSKQAASGSQEAKKKLKKLEKKLKWAAGNFPLFLFSF